MQMFRTPHNVVVPSGDYFDSEDRVDVRPTRRTGGGDARRVRPQLRKAVSLG
jgi:hypothetical protein